MENLKFINVSSDTYELFEYCKKQGFYDGTEEEFYENGEELTFFEGDPDMIKIAGEIGYFALCDDVVFYYIDEFFDTQARGILRDFFKSGDVANYSYFSKFHHTFKAPENCQNWTAWDRLETAIAYRGGCGYVYDIIPLRTDCKISRY